MQSQDVKSKNHSMITFRDAKRKLVLGSKPNVSLMDIKISKKNDISNVEAIELANS